MKGKIHFWILIGFILINSLIYWPTLFEPTSYGDECIYLTLGQGFNQGLVFYRDIHDNKPPFLYLVAAFSHQLPVFRFLALIWKLIGLILIGELAYQLSKKWLATLLSLLTFTLGYLFFEGKVANGEIFMMTPAIAAIYLFWIKRKALSPTRAILIGALFALGFLFKVPVFFDFLALLTALFFPEIKSLKKKVFWGLILGFTLPIILSIIYYALQGAFTPYVRSALLQNIGYLSSWQGSNQGLFIRGLLLMIATFGLWRLKSRLSFDLYFISLWFIFALFGALLSARPYPHYLIQIVPALSLLIGLISKPKAKSLLLAGAALSLVIAVYHLFHFWWYPLWPDYQKTLSYLTGQIDKENYLKLWGERTAENYHLAQFIRQTTSPQERIFVWGEASCIYALSQRLPPGRYTVNYHLFDFNGFQETLAAIQKTRPKLIIKMIDESRSWPELDQLLSRDYRRLIKPDLKDQIYLRIGP